jgi:hypothetical protein
MRWQVQICPGNSCSNSRRSWNQEWIWTVRTYHLWFFSAMHLTCLTEMVYFFKFSVLLSLDISSLHILGLSINNTQIVRMLSSLKLISSLILSYCFIAPFCVWHLIPNTVVEGLYTWSLLASHYIHDSYSISSPFLHIWKYFIWLLSLIISLVFSHT